tara:strand:- start:1736 stop:2014 length:279 start_codon:yes stop_codon:yes gene_type:complete
MKKGKYELKYSNYAPMPRFVMSEIVEAESPLHAGLLFARMSVGEKKKVTVGMVVHKVNGGDFEVHAKKNFVGGTWIFHGQVYKDKSPFMITS